MNAHGIIIVVLALALTVPAMAQVDTGEYVHLQSQFPAGTVNWALGAGVEVVGAGFYNPQNKDALTDGVMEYRGPWISPYFQTAPVPYAVDGDGQYAGGDYVQIDLGEARKIDTVAATFSYDAFRMNSGGFDIWLSTDGVVWYQVELSTTPYITDIPIVDGNSWVDAEHRGTHVHSHHSSAGAVAYAFAEEEVRFVRLTDFTTSGFGFNGVNSSAHLWMTEVLVTGSVIPEPATMSLLALGGLAMLRRRT